MFPFVESIPNSNSNLLLSCRDTKAEIIKSSKSGLCKHVVTHAISVDISEIEWEFKVYGDTNNKDFMSYFSVGYTFEPPEKICLDKCIFSGSKSGGFRLQNRLKFNLTCYDNKKEQHKLLEEHQRITPDTTFNIKLHSNSEKLILSKLSIENPGELIEIASIPTRYDAIESSVRLVFAISTNQKGTGIKLVNTKDCMRRIKLHCE